MPMNMKLWRVLKERELKELPISSLKAEDILEDWIENNPSILGLELLLIGRQVTTDYGGRIDLLAIDREGDITIIELKKDKTSRNVVAQILDYASWVRLLTFEDLDSIVYEYRKKDLSTAYTEFFEEPLPDPVNVYHKMIIVAAELDDTSQRIVEYLATEHHVNINAIFFNFFKDGAEEMLGRAWLMDPEEVAERAEAKSQVPWTGFWYVNLGEGVHRNWDDNVKYGYIAAGQGSKYSNQLAKLEEGDPIFAYLKGRGYVGYGIVKESAKMVRDFIVEGKGPLLEQKLVAPRANENCNDPELSDYAVAVEWKKTFKREEAKTFPRIFAKQPIVCKLKQKPTLDFLKVQFDVNE